MTHLAWSILLAMVLVRHMCMLWTQHDISWAHACFHLRDCSHTSRPTHAHRKMFGPVMFPCALMA